MFAYCGNNPVNGEDSSGTYHRTLNSGIRSVCYEAPGTRGTALAQLQNEGPAFDGTFVYYENTEECCGGVLTAQLGVANMSSPGVTGEGFSLGGFDVSLIRCGWKGFCHEVEFGNMLNASLSTDISWSGSGSLNLMLSAWSPSLIVVTDRGTFTYTLHIGAIGAGIEWGHPGYGSFNIAHCGIGFGFSYQK